jgi:primosomal protein N'
MEVRALVQARYAPVVLVAATPAAEALCQAANGLTIVELLQPYSHVTGISGEERVGCVC